MAYLRCKACGFILIGDRLGDVCPACGAPKQVFEEYQLDISEKRKKILDLHIHPIMVHFPQAISILILLFSGLLLIFPDFYPTTFYCSIPILAVLLPIFTVFTILTGFFDGKTRFKKLDTPYLKKKIIFGLIFLSVSIFITIISFFLQTVPEATIITFILSLIAVGSGGILGLIGGQLVCPAIKG